MRVYIPLAIGQTVADEVIDNINEQSLQCSIQTVSTYGHLFDAHSKEEREKKLTGIMNSRNQIVSEFLLTDDQFCVIQDRDVTYTSEDILQRAYYRIAEDETIGVVFMNGQVHDGYTHYNLQSAMFRRKVFDNFKFRWDERLHGCECVKDDLLKNGWKLEILHQITKPIRVINYAD